MVIINSDANGSSLDVKLADKAYHIGPPEVMDSYLNVRKDIGGCHSKQGWAIHPGRSFRANNLQFTKVHEKQLIISRGPLSHYTMKSNQNIYNRRSKCWKQV